MKNIMFYYETMYKYCCNICVLKIIIIYILVLYYYIDHQLLISVMFANIYKYNNIMPLSQKIINIQ